MTGFACLNWRVNGEINPEDETTGCLSEIASTSLQNDNTGPIKQEFLQEHWRD